MTLDEQTSDQVLAEAHLAGVDRAFLGVVDRWLEEPLRGCTRGAVREASFVLAELLSNAFRHARPPFAVRVALPQLGGALRLEVHDGMASSTTGWPLGSGLRVVRALCPDWGIEHEPDGKAVWAELPILVSPADV
ncbi:MAG: ATP-binding protein [Actinophytocola sp.]|uniref:ATP-binding protein n=1 Tax=Actinophytocola sp. TaxID=1872138 RepID=UPI003D6C4CD0